jgi:hypothetical protein
MSVQTLNERVYSSQKLPPDAEILNRRPAPGGSRAQWPDVKADVGTGCTLQGCVTDACGTAA